MLVGFPAFGNRRHRCGIAFAQCHCIVGLWRFCVFVILVNRRTFPTAETCRKRVVPKKKGKTVFGKTLKTVYIILGSITLVLGTLGIFLPVLPTTPFYLLTAWLYMRSSPKLYHKVMNNKYFGTIVRNFQEDKSISLKIKVVVISTLWGTILFSIFLVVFTWWGRLLLLLVAVGVTIHVLSYRTKRKQK